MSQWRRSIHVGACEFVASGVLDAPAAMGNNVADTTAYAADNLLGEHLRIAADIDGG